MLRDHEDAAQRVKQLVERLGGRAGADSGPWGAWSHLVMATANVFGDKPALKALKEGEESGMKVYQRIFEDSSAPAGSAQSRERADRPPRGSHP